MEDSESTDSENSSSLNSIETSSVSNDEDEYDEQLDLTNKVRYLDEYKDIKRENVLSRVQLIAQILNKINSEGYDDLDYAMLNIMLGKAWLNYNLQIVD